MTPFVLALVLAAAPRPVESDLVDRSAVPGGDGSICLTDKGLFIGPPDSCRKPVVCCGPEGRRVLGPGCIPFTAEEMEIVKDGTRVLMRAPRCSIPNA
jgi:hypothetical protein